MNLILPHFYFNEGNNMFMHCQIVQRAKDHKRVRMREGDYIEGEERTLRGYKLQFSSRDGKYKCMDMDIIRSIKDTGERFVNINTISQLIYNGVKYVVE